MIGIRHRPRCYGNFVAMTTTVIHPTQDPDRILPRILVGSYQGFLIAEIDFFNSIEVPAYFMSPMSHDQ